MSYKRLWILLEGNDDERFFLMVIKSIFEKTYDFVRPWQYAQEPERRIKNFLKSIKAMNSDYFFLADINHLPCVTAKKNIVKRKYGATIDSDNIITVVKEIESWYLAGLDEKASKELGISTLSNTDNTIKEDFNNLIPKKFDSRIDFMAEILKRFSIATAKRKNKSFKYFMARI